MGRGSRPDGVGQIDGRSDLRGLPLAGTPLTLGDSQDPGAGIVWESLDLSGASLDALHLFGARIRNCVFDRAGMVDLRVWGSSVTNCSFRRADLRNAILAAGEWHGLQTVWKNVTFDGAKLNRAVFTGAVLRGCTFDQPGKLLQLQDCSITGCTFSGLLDSLIIDGRGHRHPVAPTLFSADFSRAAFRNTRIVGYHLDQAALPAQSDLLLVHRYPETLAQAADWLQHHEPDETSHRAGAFLRRLAAAPGPAEDADTCFDIDALGDAPLAEAVRRALVRSATDTPLGPRPLPRRP